MTPRRFASVALTEMPAVGEQVRALVNGRWRVAVVVWTGRTRVRVKYSTPYGVLKEKETSPLPLASIRRAT